VVDGSPAAGPGFLPARSGFVNLIDGSPFLENGAGMEALHAQLADGPEVPQALLVASEGPCALYAHPAAGFCDPACQDSACLDGACVPYPRPIDAGLIEVEGLRAPLVFEPTAVGYAVRGEAPVGAPFTAGAEVTASAAGGDAPGFTLRATAPPAIAADRSDLVALEPGGPATWTWDAGGRVQLGLRRGWHGAPYTALVLCEVEEVGEVTVPEALIAAYIDQTGASTVDYWWLARFERDVVEAAGGPVELFVATMDYRFQLD
jgi:hypothetical protein